MGWRAEVIGPAQQRLDLGGEDLQIEGLCQQVVPAQLHGHHHVHVVRGGGEEQDGHLGDPADLLTPVIAVKKRQHYVYENDVGIAGGKLAYDVLEILRQKHLVSPGFYLFFHGLRKRPVVFNYEYPVHGFSFDTEKCPTAPQ